MPLLTAFCTFRTLTLLRGSRPTPRSTKLILRRSMGRDRKDTPIIRRFPAPKGRQCNGQKACQPISWRWRMEKPNGRPDPHHLRLGPRNAAGTFSAADILMADVLRSDGLATRVCFRRPK